MTFRREWSDNYGNDNQGGGMQMSFGPKTPPMTKWLLIIMVVVFAFQILSYFFFNKLYLNIFFSFRPERVVRDFEVWRFVTYMFLHGYTFHLLINLFIFWMFAREVELHFGKWQFLTFVLFCSICGAAVSCMFPGWYNTSMVGASGAILGILGAWGMLWPNRVVLLMFVFPIKVKWMVLIIAAMDLAGAMGPTQSDTAFLAHLGGMAGGAVFVWLVPRIEIWLEGRVLSSQRSERNKETDIRNRVDKLLDKINRSGITSLTEKEKKFLSEASKRYKK